MADPVRGAAAPQGEDPTAARLVRLRRDDRRPLLFTLAAIALLVVAVLKPWGALGEDALPAGSGRPSAGPTASAAPTSTPAPTPPGYDAPGGQCYPGADWRAFALEMNGGSRVRAWLSIEPRPATGPQDPAIPFVRIVADSVLALGFCVGSGPGGPRPLAGVRAWSLDPEGGATSLELAALVEYMPSRRELGAVYRPPDPGQSLPGDAWSPGRYVFAVRQGPADRDVSWFGVEIILAPQASAAP